MTLALPTCETCRHWILSRLQHRVGQGVCTHPASVSVPARIFTLRPVYVLASYLCEDFDVPRPSVFGTREGA